MAKAGCAKCNLENGAVGISDIEGKIARVATREFGNDRVSRKKERRKGKLRLILFYGRDSRE